MHWSYTGFPQTSFEKFQWFFNDTSRQNSKFHDNTEHYETENIGPHIMHGRLTHLMSYDHYWVFLRKLSISEFNDFSMSNWAKIQWFFHDFFHFYKFQELFMKFNVFSMIWKKIWISMIFQELWEPCYISFALTHQSKNKDEMFTHWSEGGRVSWRCNRRVDKSPGCTWSAGRDGTDPWMSWSWSETCPGNQILKWGRTSDHSLDKNTETDGQMDGRMVPQEPLVMERKNLKICN